MPELVSVPAAPAAAKDEAAPQRPLDLHDPSLYINRQISWLSFNERVLNEALDPYWPLLERLKFLAIFHSNLDEFFMIRVSGLHEQLEAAVVEDSADGLSPRDQLRSIAQICRRQVEAAAKLFSAELAPALAKQRIHIRDWKSLSAETKKQACASTTGERCSRC